MKLSFLLVFVVVAHGFPNGENKSESQFSFGPLDEVRVLGTGLLNLGHTLKDFVQKTKDQMNDIFKKLNMFDRTFYDLHTLASDIKVEEEQLKQTTVVLKANNEELKNLSHQINTKVEDIIQERNNLRSHMDVLDQKMTALSEGLLSSDQLTDIAGLKDMVHSQERSISDLRNLVRTQGEQLHAQTTQIKSLEKKINDSYLQETPLRWMWNRQNDSASGYLVDNTSGNSLQIGFPAHCGDVYAKGIRRSGVYSIKPAQSPSFLVYCEITADRASTVIQRRQGGSLDFDQTWERYEDGFGNITGEFWLGLKKIYAIAQHNDTILQLQAEGSNPWTFFTEYHLKMENASSDYAIHIRSTHTKQFHTLRNESDQTGIRFSTKDHLNNDLHCANDYTGGWWFRTCDELSWNGRYIRGSLPGRIEHRIGTKAVKIMRHFTLTSTQMTIRHKTTTHGSPLRVHK